MSSDYNGLRPLVITACSTGRRLLIDMFRRLARSTPKSHSSDLKSYEGTSSTGVVKQVVGLSEDIAGRDIIVVRTSSITGDHHQPAPSR